MPDLVDMRELRLHREQWVAATPARVYELVSDVGAMAAWSPELESARYDEGNTPAVGSWFTGRNKNASHAWETRMRVTEADPAAVFAWTVISEGAEITRWRYTFRPRDAGTLVEESWQVFRVLPVMGGTREELMDLRSRTAVTMEATLAALAVAVHGQRQHEAAG